MYDMTRSTLGTQALPDKVLVALKRLGENIRIARQRRTMTQEVMSRNMYVTTKTLRKEEG